ncbi:hypothetical protein IV203_028456 [Nitzschia inconspicua]|uniref:Uncharacterized protein n=1 Tax=Nitzschia inconspicua TaxID=303405 RepID=A0A9K3PZX8_9STRA|nr:hypothetical protein IV203_028456 [Nitzschia inconspicua]
MMKCSSLVALFLVAVQWISLVNGDCDQCRYDGNDASDCFDYGLIDNSVLIAWPLGGPECLETYDIVVSSPSGDPSLICASANAFVNELRLGSSLSQAKQGLGVQEGGGFFNDDATGTLKDSISIDGQTYDCEASSSDCYDAMKEYFDNHHQGRFEMQQVCQQLRNRIMNDKQLEQSVLRTRLCLESLEGDDIPSTCEPLWTELQTQMDAYPDKDCQGFAFGVQDMVIPGCEGTTEDGDGDGTDEDGGDSSGGGGNTSNGTNISSTAFTQYVTVPQWILILSSVLTYNCLV